MPRLNDLRALLRTHRIIACILALAVVWYVGICLILVTTAAQHPQSLQARFPIIGGGGDSIEYATLATHLATAGTFSLEEGRTASPETFRTPGYPVFLMPAVLLGTFDVAIVMQILLATGSALLLYRLARSFLSEAWAAFAAALFLFDPTTLFGVEFITSEALYTFLLLLAASLILIPAWRSHMPKLAYLVAGASFGASVLVRPSGLLIGFPIGSFFLWQRFNASITWKQIGIFAAASLLVIAPWSVRNGIETGVYGLSSVGAYNAVNFNVPLFLAYQNGTTVEATRSSIQQSLGNLTDAEERDLRNSADLEHAAISAIRPHLLSYAFFHVFKSANFFLASGIKFDHSFWEGFYGSGEVAHSWDPNASVVTSLMRGDTAVVSRWLISNTPYAAESVFLALVVAAGAYYALRKPTDLAILLWLIILTTALLTGPVANARYRAPVVPFLYLLGVAGLSTVLKRDRSVRI